jgi:chromosome segregation protein
MLKKLEIAGFKSFGRKTVLEFTTPVTAIVGPNGSGKSNIVEAIRFVLGEQSMKSLRGKAGTDLIFKGSKGVSAPSRASVAITFDNSSKVFSFSAGSPINIDFDEIIISREVYADGVNRYLINGSEVRLKDILELLASVHIGASGHHIISQGEADRVLNASAKDRRAMIEDALGLKVYQYKIKESERKLEKTQTNMKEVESLRREIAPHLSFLKKQVEKIEKANSMRDELTGYYKTYFGREAKYIKYEKEIRVRELEQIKKDFEDCERALENYTHHQAKIGDPHIENVLRELEQGLIEKQKNKEDLERTIGRFEGMLEALTVPTHREGDEGPVTFSRNEIAHITHTLLSQCDQILATTDIAGVHASARTLRTHIEALNERVVTKNTQIDSLEIEARKEELLAKKSTLALELATLSTDINAHSARINEKRTEIERNTLAHRDAERAYYEITGKRAEIESRRKMATLKEEQLEKVMIDFAQEVHEAQVLVGNDAIRYEEIDGGEHRHEQEDLRRKIERIKIKLEDVGGGGAEVLKEFKETEERDAFLTRELADITTSVSSLRTLITDLKVKLDVDFKTGVDKINHAFQEFFVLMFGGGGAFLAVTMEHKKIRKAKDTDDDFEVEDDEQEEGEEGFERGIEINVSLPQKKVRDLNMLSGGERSLTSIALLFAMSQVNPPPLLVLDETDAALDEANSRKYGNMLENLSKYSELIVVTHNRETMSRAHVLYGITMGAEGASKLLSIKFDEATSYAK